MVRSWRVVIAAQGGFYCLAKIFGRVLLLVLLLDFAVFRSDNALLLN